MSSIRERKGITTLPNHTPYCTLRPELDWQQAAPSRGCDWSSIRTLHHIGGTAPQGMPTCPLPLVPASFQGLPPGSLRFLARVAVAHHLVDLLLHAELILSLPPTSSLKVVALLRPCAPNFHVNTLIPRRRSWTRPRRRCRTSPRHRTPTKLLPEFEQVGARVEQVIELGLDPAVKFIQIRLVQWSGRFLGTTGWCVQVPPITCSHPPIFLC